MGAAFGNEGFPVMYMPGVSRYEQRFERVDGEWKLYGLTFSPLMQKGMWMYDPAQSTGWSILPETVAWPRALERYEEV